MLKSSTAALILAAGESHRFGGVKALAPWVPGGTPKGKATTLLAHAIATARSVCRENILVVTGGHAAALRPHLKGVEQAYNEAWTEGMGGSIAVGLAALLKWLPKTAQVVILPIDQPLVTPAHLQALIEAAHLKQCLALTSDGAQRGPPAALPAKYFPQALTLTGERRLKTVLRPAEICTVENSQALRDADTPGALAILARLAQS